MIITLTGSNTYALSEERNKIVQAFLSEHSDMGFEQFDGANVELGTLLATLSSVPFLGTKRLVIAQDLATNKSLSDQADTILGAVADTTDLVLVEPRLDKRTVYYKTLKKKTDFREFAELDDRQLASWLTQEAPARVPGGSLAPAEARYLVERVGADQERLSNELDKLLNNQPVVTREVIDLLVEPAPTSTIFELLEAAFSKNTQKALALYRDQRIQRVEPQQIIAMLAWQLHILAIVKAAGQRSSSDIAREAKINPYVVQKTQSLARQVDMVTLKQMVKATLALEVKLKSQTIDPDAAMEHYLLSLAVS